MYVPFNYIFEAATTEPPTAGDLRLDALNAAQATHVWFSTRTADSVDISVPILTLRAGDQIVLQDKNVSTSVQTFTLNASVTAKDNGNYYEAPVVWESGQDALSGGQEIVAMCFTGADAGLTSGGTPPPPDPNPLAAPPSVRCERCGGRYPVALGAYVSYPCAVDDDHPDGNAYLCISCTNAK